MNKLSIEEKFRVVACLVKGNSLRATVRMTGIHRTTIQNLLVELGHACSDYQDKVMRNLPCKRIQCDEIWPLWGARKRTSHPNKKPKDGEMSGHELRSALIRNLSLAGSLEHAMAAQRITSCKTYPNGSPIASS